MGNKFTSVTVPDINAYDLVIGIGAFEGCNNLQEITLPFIGGSFEDETYTWFGYIFGAGGYEANSTYVPDSLKKVTIGDGISFVGRGAFYKLSGLRFIDIPYTVTTVYPYAFSDTAAIHEFQNTISFVYNSGHIKEELLEGDIGMGLSGHLTLPEGVVRIGYRAFVGCDNLTKITLPDSLTSIGKSAFGMCIGLTEITIPPNVKTIEDNAFPHSEYSHDSGKLSTIIAI